MPSDTPPCRVKKAWRIFGKSVRGAASMNMVFQISGRGAMRQAGNGLDGFMCNGENLKQLTHACCARLGETGESTIDIGCLSRSRALLQGSGTRIDAECL